MATPLFSDGELPSPPGSEQHPARHAAQPPWTDPAEVAQSASAHCVDAYRRLLEAQRSGDPRAIGAAHVGLELALAVAKWSSAAGVHSREPLPGRPGPVPPAAGDDAAAAPADRLELSGLMVGGEPSGGSGPGGRLRSRRWSGLLARPRMGGRSRL